jgi:hypothetical protein
MGRSYAEKLILGALLFQACGAPRQQHDRTELSRAAMDKEIPSSPNKSRTDADGVDFEVVGTQAGVFRYDIAQGELRQLCAGPAEDIFRIDDLRALFTNPSSMTLNVCDLRSGRVQELTQIRLGSAGPVPVSARTQMGKDRRYACVLALSTYAANPGAATRNGIISAWLTVDIERKTVDFDLRMNGDDPSTTPSACSPAAGGWRSMDEKAFPPKQGIFLVPVLPTPDNQWLVVRGSGRKEGAVFVVPVFFMERSSGRLYPLQEGMWPSPVDPTQEAVNRVSLAVVRGSRVMAVHTEGWVAVGEYLVRPGVRAVKVSGDIARSYRRSPETYL